MTDKKVTQLSAASGGDVTPDDVFPLVDGPGGTPTTKKVTIAQLRAALLPVLLSELSGLATGVAAFLATALPANVAAWLADPSGANLGAALTSPVPISKGGTGRTTRAEAAVAIAALNVDWSLGEVFTKAMTAGAQAFTFSNQASGMVVSLRLTANAGGSTATWPASVKWTGGAAPTWTASKARVVTFVHDGTDIIGAASDEYTP